MLRVLILVLALSALACSRPGQGTGPASDAASLPKSGGTLTLALRQDPTAAYDRMKTNIWFEIQPVGVALWGYGNLIRLCRDDFYKLCPELAESWEANADYSQWTFKIRDGVKWHDGTAFTAEDVKFWLEMVMGKAQGGGKTRRAAAYVGDFKGIQTVEVVDGNRLKVGLDGSFPLFLQTMTRSIPSAAIAHPRHLAAPRIANGEVDISPQDLGFMGTGPFTMVKQEKGVGIEVRRSDSYWEKDEHGKQLPYLDGVRYAVIGDPAAMDAAFRTGRLDGGSYGRGHTLSGERKEAYERDLGGKVNFVGVVSSNEVLSFNTLVPGPQQDARVRQAISLWIDRQSAAKALAGGLGQPIVSMSPGSPFTAPNAASTWPGWNPATREADRAKAKQLMAEAGYANGFSINTFCYNIPSYAEVCEFHKAQLAGLGINLNLELGDQAKFTMARQTLDYPVIPMPGITDVIDPELAEPAVGPHSRFNSAAGKHEDPKVTEYFERIRASREITQRTNIWREFERYYILEKAYIAPIFAGLAVTPYRSYVKGILGAETGADRQQDLAIVWLDK